MGERDRHAGIEADNRHRASIPKKERCAHCDGTGNEFYAMYRRCSKCGGTGREADVEER